jgi:hypothetical protein
MIQDINVAKTNLQDYPFIKRYLGDIIDQRFKIENYEYGMLTAQLLNEPSKTDLRNL